LLLDNFSTILQGCLLKDPKYQKAIYDRYKGFALKIAFRYIYRYDGAVDIVNDAFVKLFKNLSSIVFTIHEVDNEKILLGWFKKIIANTAIDALRKSGMISEIGGIPDDNWDIKDTNENAEELLHFKDLITLIKHLPPMYRIVFNLYVLEGYTHADISETLNISVGASKSNLSRARDLLKLSIKKLEEVQVCSI
jgi:RNA polymerase sigma factor (sigma-70 family)